MKIEALAAQKRASDAQAQKRLNSTSGTNANGKEMTGRATAAEKEVPASVPTSARGQKRTREVEVEKDYGYRPDLALQVPDRLKARLVDDWEWITKDQRLVPIPKEKTSVSHILHDYRLSVPMKRPGSAEAEIFEECLNGLQAYFDKTLGTILLYRFERQQYADVRKKFGDTAMMSDIYGAEHLLRLFVSMQDLVSQTQMDPQAVSVLRQHLQDLMTFLARHPDLFVEEYDVTAPSYNRILNLS